MTTITQPRCTQHPRRTGRRMPKDTSCAGCWALYLHLHRERGYGWMVEMLGRYAMAVVEQDSDQIEQGGSG